MHARLSWALKIRRQLPISRGMSFEAAIGRIDQILQFQQQVLDPGAAVSSSSSSGGAGLSTASTGAGTASSATAATDFASALASAQAASDSASATGLLTDGSTDGTTDGSLDSTLGQLTSSLYPQLGTSSTAGVTSGLASAAGSLADTGSDGAAPSAANPQLEAMIDEANSLVGKPYIWGGGHSNWAPQAGYDCSGFVSAVLHAGGYLSSPQDTATLPSASGIEPGPGQYVTIYDRDESGQEGHVIIDLDGQFYESGGEAGPWGGGGGVERIATPSAAYLATFNDILHPVGL
jgi:cell wall-associated NlpC family hydrolase